MLYRPRSDTRDGRPCVQLRLVISLWHTVPPRCFDCIRHGGRSSRAMPFAGIGRPGWGWATGPRENHQTNVYSHLPAEERSGRIDTTTASLPCLSLSFGQGGTRQAERHRGVGILPAKGRPRPQALRQAQERPGSLRHWKPTPLWSLGDGQVAGAKGRFLLLNEPSGSRLATGLDRSLLSQPLRHRIYRLIPL